jgi:hypothetical protein
MIWALGIALFGVTAQARVPPSTPTLEGRWELSRFDDVPVPEAPPDGMSNLQVAFSRDGTIRTMTHLDREPRVGRYQLEGSDFSGWLGLTNDTVGRGKLSWATDNRFELTYPDGTVASFRRVSSDATLPSKPRWHCIPVTVRNVDYDAERVVRAKRLLDRAARETPPSTLLGAWRWNGRDGGAETSVHIRFGKNGVVTRCTVETYQFSPRQAHTTTADYSVADGFLMSELFGCGEPTSFRITAQDELVLDLDGEFRLRRDAEATSNAQTCE